MRTQVERYPSERRGVNERGSPRAPLNQEFRAAGHSDEAIRELRHAIAAQADFLRGSWTPQGWTERPADGC